MQEYLNVLLVILISAMEIWRFKKVANLKIQSEIQPDIWRELPCMRGDAGM